MQLFDKNFKGFRYARFRYVFTFDDSFVGFYAANNVVRFDGEDLLQSVSGAISFQGPNLHLTKTLSAKLCFTAKRLLRNQRVRTGRTGMDLVVDQMMQFQHIYTAYGNLIIKRLACTAVIQPGFATWINACQFQGSVHIFFMRTVKNRYGHFHCFDAFFTEFIDLNSFGHAIFFNIITGFFETGSQTFSTSLDLHTQSAGSPA